MTDTSTEEVVKDLKGRIDYAEQEINRLNQLVGRVELKADKLEDISGELKIMIEAHKLEITELKTSIEGLTTSINEIADSNKYELLKISHEVALIHKDLTGLLEIPNKLNDHMIEMKSTTQVIAAIKRITVVITTAVVTMVVHQMFGQ